MKSSIFIVLFQSLCLFVLAMASVPELSKRSARFISFDSSEGRIDVDLDLSIPFISIPLNNAKESDDHQKPLVNINTKSITIAGILAAITVFIAPLFFKSQADKNYRFDDDFGIWEASQSMKELVLANNYITPCVQLAICDAITRSNQSKIPSSVEKVVDGISNIQWIRNMVNGTVIQDAIEAGHQKVDRCSSIFANCAIPSQFFFKLLNELWIN